MNPVPEFDALAFWVCVLVVLSILLAALLAEVFCRIFHLPKDPPTTQSDTRLDPIANQDEREGCLR